jgi:uncharacterized protein (TIGR02099 family)
MLLLNKEVVYTRKVFMLNRFMSHYLVNLAGWVGLCLILLASTVLLSLRYWILPNIDDYREEIATLISRTAQQIIRIDGIEANWDGLRPHLLMHGVRVFDAEHNPVLMLSEIEGTVSWRSVLRGEINFHEIIIDRPALMVRRDAQGSLHVAGIALQTNKDQGGFGDWLLHQRRVIIRQAGIFWQDELRSAPVLYFDSVNFRLQNDRGGKHHRFGLQAYTSADLISRIDIRGDFMGVSIKDWSAWHGRLYVNLQDFVLENWLQWLSLPDGYELAGGAGTIRAWLDVGGGELNKWTADVVLQDTAIRLAEQLPRLWLDRLQGRLGQARMSGLSEIGTYWFADHLGIGLKGAAPLQIESLAWQQFRNNRQVALQHRLLIDQLDLVLLTNLIPSLPFSENWRTLILKLFPVGVVSKVKLGWLEDQSEKWGFNLQADFNNLSTRTYDSYPAVSGLSGTIQATESVGILALVSQNLQISGKKSAAQKWLFNSLTGQIGWRLSPEKRLALLAIGDLDFSSKEVAGRVRGYYRPAGVTANDKVVVDGKLSRGDLALLQKQLTWLPQEEIHQSVRDLNIAGKLSDTVFQINGNLKEVDTWVPVKGVAIHAQTEVRQVRVKLSNSWPEISSLSGRLSLQENNLSVFFTKGKIGNIDLQKLKVALQGLSTGVSAVQFNGEASGDSGEMIDLAREGRFVRPEEEWLHQIRMTGKSKLSLELDAVRNDKNFLVTRLKGRYQLIDNQIDLGRHIPDLNEISGALVFTQSDIALEKLHGKILGGPVNITSVALPEVGLRIQADGDVDFDALMLDYATTPESMLQLWGRFFNGSTAWSSTIDMVPDGVSVVVMSDLKGLGLSLPAPLAKNPTESMPFYFQKHLTKARHELMTLRFGEVMAAQFERIREQPYHYHPIRTTIHFGTDNQLPTMAAGTTIKGVIPKLEWDQWQELIKLQGHLDAVSGRPLQGLDGIFTPSAYLDLRIDQLEYLGSFFNKSHLMIDRQGNAWTARVTSQELDGSLSWSAPAPHRVQARLSKLVIPARAQQAAWLPANHHQISVDWPSINLTADRLVIDKEVLGRLTLSADQRENGWHLEKLQIVYPDGELRAKGVWRNHTPPFVVNGNLRLQTTNMGSLLSRHGQKNWVARGEGKAEGDLQWNGKPTSVDFPSLSGNLNITAERGQLIKLKPGIGKLLGIFDLKSLPRRLMLDFNDLLGKGFGFDYLSGNITFNQGVATLQNMMAVGSSANLALTGELDLVNKTQSLNLKSFPSFGLATPVAGIASMITTLTLQNPFDRVLLSEYAITGSWDVPEVIKLDDRKGDGEVPVEKN